MGIEFEHSVVANEYGFYCVPNAFSHRELAKVLHAGEVYEPATLRFLRRHVGTGDIATGGAFIGDFFPALRGAMRKTAQIHSFEPNPLSFAAALETVRINDLGGVKLAPVAVGAKPAILPMRIAQKDGSSIAAAAKIVDSGETGNSETIDVKVTTLDSLVPKSRTLSILHLDIEGYEENALRGASRLLNDHRPLVVLECGKPWKARNFQTVLSELAPNAGYQFSGEIENNAIFRSGPKA